MILGGINLYDIIMGLLLLSCLLFVGDLIRESLNFSTISISIIYYLFSIFVLDVVMLLIGFRLTFEQNFLSLNICWIVYFLYKKYFKKLSITLFAIFSSSFLFNYFEKNLTKNSNITGDVDAVFYLQAKQIFENSYYFSVNNFVMEGYPQFLSYFQALFLKFIKFNGPYEFYSFTSHIVFYLTLIYFFELKIQLSNKVILVSTFSLMILNSDWLQFLMSTSLMSEGLVNLFAVVCLTELLKTFETKNEDYRIYILFGILYLSKQFLSSIVLIVLVILFLKQKNKTVVLFGFLGLFLKEILYIFPFADVSKDHHIRQIDVVDTIFDLLQFRDIEIQNIIFIIKNVFLDKPFTILLILFYFLFFYSKIFLNHKNFISDYIFYIVNLNSLLVFILYISVWRFMELESPVRYLLNFLTLIFVYIFTVIERTDK